MNYIFFALINFSLITSICFSNNDDESIVMWWRNYVNNFDFIDNFNHSERIMVAKATKEFLEISLNDFQKISRKNLFYINKQDVESEQDTYKIFKEIIMKIDECYINEISNEHIMAIRSAIISIELQKKKKIIRVRSSL